VGSYKRTKKERRGELMGIWYIETWTVSKGKVEEHDEVVKKWISYIIKKFKIQTRFFNKMFGPMGGRVGILEFENLAEFENFVKISYKDEESTKFRAEWRSYIDPGSWKGFFWREREIDRPVT